MQLERQGAKSVPLTRMLPRVIGGVCEFCGVVNPGALSQEQYLFCPHFKGIGELRCSYCPETADPVEVIRKSNIKVHEHPDRPGTWIAVCDSYTCAKAHTERFENSAP